MKTNQMLKRDFYESTVSQRSKDGFLNANDLVNYYNQTGDKKKRIQHYLDNKQTAEFLEALVNESYNNRNSGYLKNVDISATDAFINSTRGKNGGTWMHPLVFLDFALWLSPHFKVKIYQWVYDNLVVFRNMAGDYYKEMCKELLMSKVNTSALDYVREANVLNKLVFDTVLKNQRNEAQEWQLDLMNRLQLYNIEMLKERITDDTRYINLKAFADIYKKTSRLNQT